MGENADDIIEGACCALCGQYFVGDEGELYEHGYPVACEECWEPGCGYQKACAPTL
jgi:hypothetical protein